MVIAKQGEYGAALFTEDGFFALPAYPLETVRDPTGAGDSFAGGLMGYLDSQGGATDDATLRRAMAYGSTLASFWVEEFGCERAEHLTRDEIDDRYEQFKRITAIESVSADLARASRTERALGQRAGPVRAHEDRPRLRAPVPAHQDAGVPAPVEPRPLHRPPAEPLAQVHLEDDPPAGCDRVGGHRHDAAAPRAAHPGGQVGRVRDLHAQLVARPAGERGAVGGGVGSHDVRVQLAGRVVTLVAGPRDDRVAAATGTKPEP